MKINIDFNRQPPKIQIIKDGKETSVKELTIKDLHILLQKLPEVRMVFERQYREIV